MSKRTGGKSSNAENSDPGFLSRWSARKTEIARAAATPKDSIDKQNQFERDHAESRPKNVPPVPQLQEGVERALRGQGDHPLQEERGGHK